MVKRKRTSTKVFNFEKKKTCTTSRIILATISQNDAKFGDYKNTQCTSNAVIALCMSSVQNVQIWNTATLDNILNLGNDLHLKSLSKLTYIPQSFYLASDEVDLNDIVIQNELIFCEGVFIDPNLQGYIGEHLESVLNTFRKNYQHGVFTSCSKSIGIIIKSENELWIFDPHSSNDRGLNCDNGVAVACAFENVHTLVELLERNFSHKAWFVITPFNLTKSDKNFDQERHDSETSFSCSTSSVQNTIISTKRKTKRRYTQSTERKNMIMKKLREQEKYKGTEDAKNRESKREVRKDDEKRKAANEKNKEYMAETRKDDEKRKAANEKNKEYMAETRKDDEKRKAANEKNKEYMAETRKDDEKRKAANEKNREYMTETRKDEEKRKSEREKNKESKRETRKDDEKRKAANEKNKEYMTETRKDEEKRKSEREKDKCAKRSQRCNDIIRDRYTLYQKLLRENNCSSKLQLDFLKARKEVPEYVCCCCEGLFFKHSVANLDTELLKIKIGKDKFDELSKHIFNYKSSYVCNTCKKHIAQGNVPKMATSNGLKFVILPDCIKKLSPLEERLCSPYIPFMQIRPLKSFAINPQLGVKGSVVNIPIEINECLHVLPRSFDDMATLQLQLKRHLSHKSHYMYETIRPGVVCDALMYLQQSPLYLKNDIQIDQKYFARYEKNYAEEVEFIIDRNDAKKVLETERVETDANNDSDEEVGEEVLLIDRNEVTADNIHIIAPGQDKRPVAWHLIENFDELCFPKIFAGHSFQLSKKISYSDRAKSECRRVDRRSCNPSRVLFMAKQKVEKQCIASINVCLRKTRKNIGKVNAGNLLNQEFINNLIKVDSGYRFLNQIRSSPAFWETKKKDLMAMIRQLGKPTLFLTLSAGETWWPELLKFLSEVNCRKNISLEDALNLSEYEKTNLIRNDPVTCARYFDYKAAKFINFLMASGEYSVEDYYLRVEFQQRGSPHIHSFLWLKGAPIYQPFNAKSEEECIAFIDKYITCEYNDKDPYIALQKHRHTFTCNKGRKNKNICRFHFPVPVMPRTTILHPLSEEEKSEETKKNWKNINNLMSYFFLKQSLMSFEGILMKLNLTEAEYITALRSSLNQPRVFLKRNSLEVGINCYNKNILHLFESNMDMQYVLDEYAIASYIVNYINKIDSGLSKLLKNAASEMEDGNNSLKEKFRKISNVFLNSSLMSAQEAAYCVLSLPLSKSSRRVIFINTSPRNERVLMLKNKGALQQLTPDSEDVYMEDIVQKYCKRPEKLENICLAEFVACYYKINTNKTDSNDDEQETTLKERSKPAVIRYRRYKVGQDPENYYREQVMLLLPFRNEVRDIENQNCYELFETHFQTIEANRNKFSVKSDDLLEEALETINNQVQLEDLTESDDDEAFEKVNICDQGGIDTGDKQTINRFTAPKRVQTENLYEMMISLNNDQREFVMHVLHSFKTGNTPLRIFLSGSAGVGKSTVINSIYQIVTHYFDNLPGSVKDKMVVLLCAPSGKAAFLIGGVTLHTAFALPVTQFSGNMPELSSDIANTIREKLFHLKLLIIDEISMVGSRLLSRVDTRLRQIMGRNEYFGGLSVIVVGDLHQLPPVMDSPVFKFPSNNEFSALADANPIWEQFEFYELTKIMRQKDEFNFIKALNNLALNNTTSEDVKLINSRVVKPHQVPHDAIRLYARNIDVDEYNSRRVSDHPGEEFVSKATDCVLGKTSASTKDRILNSLKSKKLSDVGGLPYELRLKIGIKYMVTSNIDVEDGLVNGTCGILKKIIFKPNSKEPHKVFMEYSSDHVGRKMRLLQRSYMESEEIDLRLTPINKSRQVLNISNKIEQQVIRVQFPLVCAEALTIHKSQGQTYDEVCLNLNLCRGLKKQMLYVALSRVTKLSGLYIIGKFNCPLRRKREDPVLLELERLRKHKSVKLCFDNLKWAKTTVVVVYQNVCSLVKKIACIKADDWYERGDVLVFSETLNKPDYVLNIEGFREIFRINSSPNKSRGISVYAKNDINLVFIDHVKKYSEHSHIDLILLQVGDYCIVTGYKSPSLENRTFQASCEYILKDVIKNKQIIFIGDFNFDIYKGNNKSILHFFEKFNLKSQLDEDISTTNNNTQIDVVFSNKKIVSGVYETYFSDHKPIYAALTLCNDELQISDVSRKLNETLNSDTAKEIDEILENLSPVEISDASFAALKLCNDESQISNVTQKSNEILNSDTAKEIDEIIENLSPIEISDASFEQVETSVNKTVSKHRDILNEILNSELYLQDDQMNLFHGIVEENTEFRPQNTLLVQLSQFIAERANAPNLQILFRKGIGKIGHWICTYYDGKRNHIYDSANEKILHLDYQTYLQRLYGKVEHVFHKVQYQQNCFDCGVFAIAFATTICLGGNPENVVYDDKVMRKHLRNMLQTRQLVQFPQREK